MKMTTTGDIISLITNQACAASGLQQALEKGNLREHPLYLSRIPHRAEFNPAKIKASSDLYLYPLIKDLHTTLAKTMEGSLHIA